MKNAYFRCDASTDIGAGHVMRCLTLAQIMHDNGFACHFLTHEHSAEIVPALSRSPHTIWAENHTPQQADFLIVDHYDLDERYENAARQWAQNIIVIDDLANRKHDCELILDQTWGRDKAEYETLTPPHCKILCGSDYALLKPEFANLRERAIEKRKQIDAVKTILISFGATNPYHLIERVLNVISQRKSPLKFHIACSSQAEGLDKIKRMAATIAPTHSVEVHINTTDMARLMTEADIAFGGGGTMSWERATLGLPTILFQLADNQKDIAKNLHNIGAVDFIGDGAHVSDADIDNSFENMRKNKAALQKMGAQGCALCDGMGAHKFFNEISTLTKNTQ